MMNQTVSPLQITVFNKARVTRGGGVKIHCLNCISVVDELDFPYEERLLLKVKSHGNIFLIAVGYIPPKINKLLFIATLHQFLESLSKGLPVLIIGDMNIDVLKQNLATLRHLATIEANGCNFLNNKITRPASNGGTCLDQAICKKFDIGMISVKVLMHENYSDQFPVLFQADLKSINDSSRKYITFRDQFSKNRWKHQFPLRVPCSCS